MKFFENLFKIPLDKTTKQPLKLALTSENNISRVTLTILAIYHAPLSLF